MIFLKKYTEIDIFFRPSENMVFPKGAAPAHDLSCIIWKDWGFFLENMIFLPWAESERRPFPAGNTWKHDASPGEKNKKTGNLIHRVEVWPLLKFIRLEIFHNE